MKTLISPKTGSKYKEIGHNFGPGLIVAITFNRYMRLETVFIAELHFYSLLNDTNIGYVDFKIWPYT